MSEFASMAQSRVEEQLWEHASKGHLGSGLQLGGGDLFPILQYREELEKQELFGKRAMLEVVATGALWLKARRHAAYPAEELSDLCPRCGRAPQTEAHAFWTCSALGQSTLPEVTDSQYLKDEAERGLNLNPRLPQKSAECLWLRGILPRDVVPVPEVGDDEGI